MLYPSRRAASILIRPRVPTGPVLTPSPRLIPFQPLSRRYASSGSQQNPLSSFLSYLKWTTLAVGTGVGILYLSDSRAAAWRELIMPAIHLTMDPEDAHVVSIWLAKVGLVPREKVEPGRNEDLLGVELWGKKISNPIGLAAGYDKHAEAIDALYNFGFGLVEIGSVTPEPQPGNPKPRMFRLPEDRAVINRYGFNSLGHKSAEGRLRSRIRSFWQSVSEVDKKSGKVAGPVPAEVEAFVLAPPKGLPRSLREGRLLGVNLGKNKTSAAESNEDYVKGVERLGAYADYIVVNVSSPNTPGLRALQRREPMLKLLQDVKEARDKNLPHKPPLVVKIAPDMTNEELEDIAAVVKTSGFDGVIISNTTITRPSTIKSDPKIRREFGGLSGAPLLPLSLSKVRKFYELSKGEIPIIGCGGIRTADDALAFAKAGASIVQLYTGLAFDGPGIVSDIKEGVAEQLRKEGKRWRDTVPEGVKFLPLQLLQTTPHHTQHSTLQDEHPATNLLQHNSISISIVTFNISILSKGYHNHNLHMKEPAASFQSNHLPDPHLTSTTTTAKTIAMTSTISTTPNMGFKNPRDSGCIFDVATATATSKTIDDAARRILEDDFPLISPQQSTSHARRSSSTYSVSSTTSDDQQEPNLSSSLSSSTSTLFSASPIFSDIPISSSPPQYFKDVSVDPRLFVTAELYEIPISESDSEEDGEVISASVTIARTARPTGSVDADSSIVVEGDAVLLDVTAEDGWEFL
ncbi:Dihydroorotate dehydrogenase (quinone), mitochondrial [Phlyctochytrium planicorne]|nr:Dihydroorotate dehydrogenase (quinone), mitochondrial [Phlyctochytrium planicorne]